MHITYTILMSHNSMGLSHDYLQHQQCLIIFIHHSVPFYNESGEQNADMIQDRQKSLT